MHTTTLPALRTPDALPVAAPSAPPVAAFGAATRAHDAALRFPALTSIRFFAALHVVAFHFWPRNGSGMRFVDAFVRCGWISVTLFFVLSGFVLTCGESRRPSTPLRFWRARFARIYPAYALALAILLPAQRLPHATAPASLGYVLAHVLLLQAWFPSLALTWNFPGWSLSAEAFFYAIFPGWLRLVRRFDRGREGRMIVAVFLVNLAGAVGYLAWYGHDWSPRMQYMPLARVGEFLVGCSLGRHFLAGVAAPAARDRRVRRGRLLLALAGAGVVALGVAGGHVPNLLVNAALLVPIFSLAVYGLALSPPMLGLSSPWLQQLGGASYALYILHHPLQHWVEQLWPGGGRLHFLAYATAAVLLSILVFRGLEEPLRRRLTTGGVA